MKKLAFFVIIALHYTQLSAQQTKIGVSLNYMNDYNWRKPLEAFKHRSFISIVNIQSRTPLNMGIIVEKKRANISRSIGINLIQRNLVYSERYTDQVTFSHNTVELPINVTKRKSIGNDAWLTLNMGVGISYILTNTSKTQIGRKSYDTLVYNFSIINPKKATGFINVGIGIENKLHNLGIIQIKLQYVYHLTAIPQYSVFNIESGGTFKGNIFNGTTKPFRTNYAMVGVTYFSSFFERKNKSIKQ